MQIQIKKLPKSRVELDIEVPQEEVESYLDKAAENLSKETEIQGFRPGKAPRKIVEEHLGEFKIYEEAGRLCVIETYSKSIVSNKIEAIGKPEVQITKIAPKSSLKFKAKVAVLPEVKLGNWKEKIRNAELKIQKAEVTEAEIAESLKYLQISRTKLVAVNREAQKGDRVEIDFEARVNGVKIEKGESRNHPLIIGEGHFVAGFEEQLIGMKQGQEKEFNLLFPESYHQKELAAKLVDFKVKMNLVQERIVPSLDDEFARSLGQFESLEKLKNNIKEGIKLEKEQKEQEKFRLKLLEKLLEGNNIEVPDILANEELKKMLAEFKASTERMGLSFEKWLRQAKKTEEELKSGWRSQAEKRVKTGLVLRELAALEQIKPNEKEVEDEINKVLKNFSDIEEAKKKLDLNELKEYIKGVITNEKALECLENVALNKI